MASGKPVKGSTIPTVAEKYPPPAVFIGRVEARSPTIQQSQSEQWRVFKILWNQGFTLVLSYLFALITFICFTHLKHLPELPFPLNKNLLDFDPDFVPYIWWPEGPALVLVIWGIIYLRKLFLLVLWTAVKGHVFNDYYQDTASQSSDTKSSTHKRSRGGRCLNVLVIGYHVLFGVWTGWANNKYDDYIITEPLLLVMGICLLAASEVTLLASSVHHVSKHMSQGPWFTFAKYGCEIITWLGFALVSFTLPACLIFVIRVFLTIYLVKYSKRAECCC